MAKYVTTKEQFSSPVDRDMVAKNWGTRGFSCNLFVDPPGQEWLGFMHATNELVTVVEGLLEVSVDGQVVILKPGDEICIPKYGVHNVINRSDGVTQWLYGYD